MSSDEIWMHHIKEKEQQYQERLEKEAQKAKEDAEATPEEPKE